MKAILGEIMEHDFKSLADAFRERGDVLTAHLMKWMDVLMEATPDNVDRLLAAYEATLPDSLTERNEYRSFVSAIRKYESYSGLGEAPRVPVN